MAVPKRKTTPSKRNMRRSHHRAGTQLFAEDKKSGELRRPHHIDLSTGMYRGKQILVKKPKKEEAAETAAPVNAEEAAKTIEAPASKYMHHLSIIESKLHRSSRSRAFICTSPSRIFAIKPNADIPAEWTPTFYPNIDPFKETSPIDVFDLNFEKFPQNVEIIEIPMSKNQILFIPRGWFIQFENVNDFNILLMKS